MSWRLTVDGHALGVLSTEHDVKRALAALGPQETAGRHTATVTYDGTQHTAAWDKL